MINTLHLTTSSYFLQQQDLLQSQFIISKFVDACLQTDASIFEPCMKENDVFEDKEKYKFLAQLKELFSERMAEMPCSFFVREKDSVCNWCPDGKGKPVKHFELISDELNQPMDGFAFLIDTENGLLKDIYRCYDYAGCINVLLGSDDMPKIKISWDLIRKTRKESST